MKIYIAGKITDNPNYKIHFAIAEAGLKAMGHTPMNPAILPDGFEHHEYMKICFSMIDVCDGIYLLSNWQDSKGAKMEHDYAAMHNKDVLYQGVGG